jgi:hypothetical protein
LRKSLTAPGLNFAPPGQKVVVEFTGFGTAEVAFEA